MVGINRCIESQTPTMANWISRFSSEHGGCFIRRRNCLPFANTCVLPSPVFYGVRFAHPFCMFLTCSSMLFVHLEFTPPQFSLVSVLLIFLICSCLVHQCFMCFLSSSPSPVFYGVRVAHLFSLFLT